MHKDTSSQPAVKDSGICDIFCIGRFFLDIFLGPFLQPVFHNAPFTDKMWAGRSNPEIWAPAANVQTRAAPERSRPNSDEVDKGW